MLSDHLEHLQQPLPSSRPDGYPAPMGCLPVMVLFVLGFGLGYLVGGREGAIWGAGIGLVVGIVVGAVLMFYLSRKR